MKIIPAVDIKNGKCVRLSQGKADQETIYSDHPQEMADHWDEEGAQLIHVVDLDGAFEGSPKNSKIVKEIIYSSSVDIQVGGGIRTLAAIEEYVNAGVYRIILGTIAQKEPEFVEQACKKFPGKIIVGIDARDGMVAVKGWVEFIRTTARSVSSSAPTTSPTTLLPSLKVTCIFKTLRTTWLLVTINPFSALNMTPDPALAGRLFRGKPCPTAPLAM